MNLPNINSGSLANAVQAAGPKINGYTSTLDDISADIVKVEDWLRKSGVRITIKVPFEEGQFIAYCDYFNERTLEWSNCEDKDGNWRIRYSNRTVFYSDSDGSCRYTGQGEYRPLIETRVDVRLKCVEPLTRLIGEIAAFIPEKISLPHQFSLFN